MSLDLVGQFCGSVATSNTRGTTPFDAMAMAEKSAEAAAFLKALAHEGRMMIMCHLISGEKSVTELEQLLSSRQAAVSQQLARLRLERLVHARRDGKAIFYSIQDIKVLKTVCLMHEMFCVSD